MGAQFSKTFVTDPAKLGEKVAQDGRYEQAQPKFDYVIVGGGTWYMLSEFPGFDSGFS